MSFSDPRLAGLKPDAQDAFRIVGRDFLDAYDEAGPAAGLTKPYHVDFDDDADRAVLDELKRAGLLSFFSSPRGYKLTDVGKRTIIANRAAFS